jgi:probable HAF family extracellular repeat protein
MTKFGLVFAAALIFAGAAEAGQFTHITIDGAKATTAVAINASGAVVGFYTLARDKEAGFLRAPDGTITTFRVPKFKNTIPDAVNDNGIIAGYSGEEQSFVRKPDGSIEVFQVEGARWTSATAINAAGYVSGTFSNADHSSGSFLRAPDGTITIVSASQDKATSVYGLNDGNVMVGQLGFGSFPQGFIFSGGDVTTLDAGTSITAINSSGTVAGLLLGEAKAQGFTRGTDGHVKPFGPKVEDMEVTGINAAGNVVGYYFDRHSRSHGFLYSHTDGFLKLDDPAIGHRQPFAGTRVTGVNDSGVAVGYVVSNKYRNTAFIWTP